jgi:DNA-binding NarL/FixJ family response regulator
VVADDSVLLREGLVRLLAEDGIDVVAVAHDESSALEAVAATNPDMVVLDVRMPPTFSDEGIRAARQIRADRPEIALLLLSQHVHVGGALELFERDRGGLGYLLKDRVIEIDGFLDAVRRVAAGGSVVDPAIVAALVSRRDPAQPLDVLTERELDVLSLMAEGLSNRAVAARLVLSLRTVETHVNNVFLKLGLGPTTEEHRRVRAVVTYLAHRA